ncbi:MAG: hypothetical protein PHW13_08230 [Methylococcales bacterium]|nr:hypothetical protein [Methylococcales bacterium]
MNLKQIPAVKPAAIALMLLMAVTRFHHFGTAFSLPDASLAVFFLAGLWLGGRYLLIALLLEAGLIDYLAITQFGGSDFCISSAYVFLIPTYAAMWLGGQWCAGFSPLTTAGLSRQFAALLMATTTAFLISNGSFFLLSGRFAEGSWAQYIDGVARYYPSYLLATVIYVAVVSGLAVFVKMLSAPAYRA